ncbi:rod shape-determining protein [Eubacteriales bacterium OttesenSCG-928-K08]|nr:rod shape-determining protein [Eubacteriales bacterium OttesenSCG-928-K08]
MEQGKQNKNVSVSQENRPPQENMPARAMQTQDIVFALDIGTRTVVGVVGKWEQQRFRVIAFEQMEHLGRAMVDGQVEDIKQVGSLILAVKQALEDRLNIKLTRVAVAAAGRMLKTVRARAERLIEPRAVANRELVVGLEGEAIERAQAIILEENKNAMLSGGFYCAGYSIVRYELDGRPISNVLGHFCSQAAVELIAAFLPNSVVEGLYAAVDAAQLEIVSLTLEPIAAMNVLIPQELRLLNLALVDIGAGTSDIAVCREGSVYSYEMATIAGDELTEAIIQKLLVDFETAERIKRTLNENSQEDISYTNILGLELNVPRVEVMEVVRPAMERLADTVSEKIRACNGEPPAAVFLIGGGSQIPGLAELLAERLPLDLAKIAVGARRSLKNVDFEKFERLSGPEFVTPLGIAVTALTQASYHFFGVKVNGKSVRLLSTSVMRCIDVLIMAGYRTTQVIGQSGRNLIFNYNGKRMLVKGGLPKHAELRCNGKPANIDTGVRPGDMIEISPAQNGAPAHATIRSAAMQAGDWKEAQNGSVKFQGEKYALGLNAKANGKSVNADYIIGQQDDIEVDFLLTGGDICRAYGLPRQGKQLLASLAGGEARPISFITPLQNGMELFMVDEDDAQNQQASFEKKADKPGVEVLLNGKPCKVAQGEEGAQVMHVLEHAGIDLEAPQGIIQILVNGEESGFMRELHEGDVVNVGWKPR